MTSPHIEDYALIGDCETAALVSRTGSIDWLCLPRFDSRACFAALLGTTDYGRWLLAPAVAPREIRRHYHDGTLVLETEFETAQGRVAVVDCMPPRSKVPDVLRVVRGRSGRVPMRMDLCIRFAYGSLIPWVRRTKTGLTAVGGLDLLELQTPVELRGENFHTTAEFTVAAGEEVPFVLRWQPSFQPVRHPGDAIETVVDTGSWWREWSSRCAYQGPYRDAVLRSLITLKALTYRPSGGLLAAPTTSLPELPGGVRNWDYRFCWLRDATFALYALMLGGYLEEGREWRKWLLRAVAGKPAHAHIVYGAAGERLLPEWELEWLPGHADSRPVRVGNAAATQFQLDVYGEVMDALHLAGRHGLAADEDAWRVQRELVKYVESAWREPDEGIWEVRGPRRHFTHSKVMAWVALDRAVKGIEQFGLEGPVERWRQARAAIHDNICLRGFDARLGAFVQYYGSRLFDASLLMIPLVGFLPADDPRMLGTVRAIERHLTMDGFVARYATRREVDGLPPGEGAFLPCTFWLADNLALQGRTDEARALFERLLGVRNDLGLLSEEYDPRTDRLLGNFPQAMSHTALVNTAANLTTATGPARNRG
ncbi:MAG: glycoside hydrolase family 15 protein [Candidatus Rokuibacteriota bacterium]